jgi:MOSC domain-containing protein YiiM
MPKEGIFAKVIQGGQAKAGDSIALKNGSLNESVGKTSQIAWIKLN